MKIGLLCEGGGTKAAYTAGVLKCLLDKGIEFPYTAGISAGAFCLLPFVSKQPERLRLTAVDATTRKEAVGLVPILKEHAVFGINATYDYVEKEYPLDWKTFHESSTECEMGLYNIETGEVDYFPKKYNDSEGLLVKAACSLLLLTKPLIFQNTLYMDGGLIDMIPIKQALKQGCEKVVFISTKEENYVRKPAPKWQLWLAKLVYPGQDHVRKDLKLRHERYAEQWKILKDMENEGKALVLRPSQDMHISRYTTDKEKLYPWFDLGYADTEAKLDMIREFIHDSESSSKRI